MKNVKFLIFAFAIISLSLSMSSCGSKTSGEKDATESVDKTGPEYASAYICPMHCAGSGSASEGKCPVCGMDYVANKDFDAKGHSHDGDDGHDHDHDDHDGHSH